MRGFSACSSRSSSVQSLDAKVRSCSHDNRGRSQLPRKRLQAIEREIARGARVSQEVNPWEHLNYFDSRSLRRMLAACGFEVVPGPYVDVGLRPERAFLARIANSSRSAVRALWFGF